MKVRVYRNLTKGKAAGRPMYSVQNRETGRVVAVMPRVGLRNAKFVVREAGRQRVLREGRKNVHAFVVGDWGEGVEMKDGAVPVGYNPYKGPSFVTGDGRVVEQAPMVVLDAAGVWVPLPVKEAV